LSSKGTRRYIEEENWGSGSCISSNRGNNIRKERESLIDKGKKDLVDAEMP